MVRVTAALNLLLTCDAAERVLLVRHCVRSNYPTLRGRGDPAFDYSDNYTAKPFPTQAEWHADGVAHCTENGKVLAETFAASLLEAGILPAAAPIRVFADDASRCKVTAEHMVTGLGSHGAYAGITKVMAPQALGLCEPETAANRTSGLTAMIELAESGNHYLSPAWDQRDALLAELQDLVGTGAAPNISSIPTRISDDGRYIGGLHVASQAMVENFILEAGANVSVAWGALDGERRQDLWQKFSPLNVLYNRLNHNGIPTSTRDGAVVAPILRALAESSSESLVLVGHDTNVDNVAALLDLTWSCGPYADNETPPHLGLLFERRGDPQHPHLPDDRVAISVVCTSIDAGHAEGEVGHVLRGEVRKAEQKFASLPRAALLAEAEEHLETWNGLACGSEPIESSVLV